MSDSSLSATVSMSLGEEDLIPENDYNELNLWTIIGTGSIREHLFVYLTVRDISVISRVCSYFRNLSTEGILWRSYFNIHMHDYKQAVLDRHSSLHECGFRWRYPTEIYRTKCANSPVYRFTHCSICDNEHHKICKSCRPKAFRTWSHCDFCDAYYGICINCHNTREREGDNRENFEEFIEQHPSGKEMKICSRCDLEGCSDHFPSDKHCDSCYNKRYKKSKKSEEYIREDSLTPPMPRWVKTLK